ncbi:MAG: lipopolysaccharide heptosyltransferase I [Gammaproteobacteria bacterium]|nr:lipopolysaccharide heptosyltransferase I [Gammaproteobacteria bacterium]
MKVLIIKTSSMGDMIHTLPALTDAKNAYPDICFDWVAEESFVEIPKWHPAVRKVMPLAIRRLRKNIFKALRSTELKNFLQELKQEKYDFIIDAQGLIKSSWIAAFATGLRCGYSFNSVREIPAALFYQKRFSVAKNLHAITRIRKLFSMALGYQFQDATLDYGIKFAAGEIEKSPEKYLVFIHAASQDNKLWPEKNWEELTKLAVAKGYKVKLPWGNAKEHERALRLAKISEQVIVLPKSSLTEIAKVLKNAAAIVAVDTGFSHLAAALGVKTITLYGPTNPDLTGAIGKNQTHLTNFLETNANQVFKIVAVSDPAS